jgi:hypothetical protein
MAMKSKLQEFLDGARSMREGDAGRLVTVEELMAFDIPGIADYDHHRRAEWLCKQLPFPCEAKPGTTVNQWSFTRLPAKPSGA